MSTEENAVWNITHANDNNVENTEEFFICQQCYRNFRTQRCLMQHLRTCKVVLHIIPNNDIEHRHIHRTKS